MPGLQEWVYRDIPKESRPNVNLPAPSRGIPEGLSDSNLIFKLPTAGQNLNDDYIKQESIVGNGGLVIGGYKYDLQPESQTKLNNNINIQPKDLLLESRWNPKNLGLQYNLNSRVIERERPREKVNTVSDSSSTDLFQIERPKVQGGDVYAQMKEFMRKEQEKEKVNERERLRKREREIENEYLAREREREREIALELSKTIGIPMLETELEIPQTLEHQKIFTTVREIPKTKEITNVYDYDYPLERVVELPRTQERNKTLERTLELPRTQERTLTLERTLELPRTLEREITLERLLEIPRTVERTRTVERNVEKTRNLERTRNRVRERELTEDPFINTYMRPPRQRPPRPKLRWDNNPSKRKRRDPFGIHIGFSEQEHLELQDPLEVLGIGSMTNPATKSAYKKEGELVIGNDEYLTQNYQKLSTKKASLIIPKNKKTKKPLRPLKEITQGVYSNVKSPKKPKAILTIVPESTKSAPYKNNNDFDFFGIKTKNPTTKKKVS